MHFYIMNAKCLFDEDKTNAEGVKAVWGDNQTILVCRRHVSGDRTQKIFVSGSGLGYIPEGTEFPIQAYYTEDTGMGHRNKDKSLIIDNVIDVDKGIMKPRNTTGVTEERFAWTMK